MSTRSVNWNEFGHIDEIPAETPADQACLEQIQAILERHGMTERFGVHLLHKHFDLAEDEVLLETQDPTSGTLTSRKVKRTELNGVDHKITAWSFRGRKIVKIGACAGGEYGSHYGYKD
jgi:hypothetical protein